MGEAHSSCERARTQKATEEDGILTVLTAEEGMQGESSMQYSKTLTIQSMVPGLAFGHLEIH